MARAHDLVSKNPKRRDISEIILKVPSVHTYKISKYAIPTVSVKKKSNKFLKTKADRPSLFFLFFP